MALPVSNSPDIGTDLNIVLGCKFSTVSGFNISVRENHQVSQGLSGQMLGYHNTNSPDVDIDLKFYIDQSAIYSKEDIFSNLESRIGELLHEVEGVFIQRSVHPFRDNDVMTISYTLKLKNYDTFISKLNYLARSKSDREFTKVLEETLTR